MAKRPLFRCLKNGSFGLRLAACALACVPAFAQIDRKPNTENAHKETLRGCPTAGSDAVYFSATDGGTYLLTGDTSLVKGYEDKEILLQGIEDDSSQPSPSFHATKIKKVFEQPKRLRAAFTDYARWHSETNHSYGVTFSHPENVSSLPSDELYMLEPTNFASVDGAITLSMFEIPQDIYPGTNFIGGRFAIRASTVITNAESCSEFGLSEPENHSRFTVGGVNYSGTRGVDGGLGTGEIEYAFHTFQNGLCYEVAVEITESWAWGAPACGMAKLDNADEMRLIEPILAGVSYIPPTIKVAPDHPQAVPVVTSFTASERVADDSTNGGAITFSWTTEETDYVEFSYHCSRVGPGVLILEDSGRTPRENASDASRAPFLVNRSPDSSLKVDFINSVGYGDDEDVPISVVVTVTPFSHGKEYANSRRSIAIEVEPASPFRLNYGKIDITFPLDADRTWHYQQGSTLALEWTDPILQDECVELYLVRNEDNAGKIFHARITDGCLKPSSGGSYTWTIPDKYSGYSYRIFARAPVSGASGVSLPFTIIKKNPHKMPD